MAKSSRTCSTCGNQFELRADHKGNINVCLNCGGQDVALKMAKVSWEGKHFPVIEIVDNPAEAIAFNKRQRRLGHGVIASITASKSNGPADIESSKRDSGTEPRAQYVTRLGEKRSVKP